MWEYIGVCLYNGVCVSVCVDQCVCVYACVYIGALYIYIRVCVHGCVYAYRRVHRSVCTYVGVRI